MLPDNFYHIAFQFTTASDNLRSNSELTADVFKHDGTAILADFELHPQDSGTWDNGSTSRLIGTDVIQTEVSDLEHIDIILRSHNDAFQADDSWQVAHVTVSLSSNDDPSNFKNWADLDGNPFFLYGHGGKTNVIRVTPNALNHPSLPR